MPQGTALREHNENEGNLYQLLKCRSKDVTALSTWLNKSQYLSHDIVNELVKVMAHKVLREILSEVRKSQRYAIIGDKTHDVSGAEQFALSLCWVDSDYVIYEDFVGLDQTDAKTLMEMLRSVSYHCFECSTRKMSKAGF